MAFKPCKVCGTKIDYDYAKKCPHCGTLKPKYFKKRLIMAAIIAIAFTFSIVISVNNSIKEDNAAKFNFENEIDLHYEKLLAARDDLEVAKLVIDQFERYGHISYKDVSIIKKEVLAAELKVKEEARFDELRIDAFGYMQQFVRGKLISPRGAKFPRAGMYWREHVTHLGDGRYRVRSYVDAQNAFGASIRVHYGGVIARKGDKWELEYLDM